MPSVVLPLTLPYTDESFPSDVFGEVGPFPPFGTTHGTGDLAVDDGDTNGLRMWMTSTGFFSGGPGHDQYLYHLPPAGIPAGATITGGAFYATARLMEMAPAAEWAATVTGSFHTYNAELDQHWFDFGATGIAKVTDPPSGVFRLGWEVRAGTRLVGANNLTPEFTSFDYTTSSFPLNPISSSASAAILPILNAGLAVARVRTHRAVTFATDYPVGQVTKAWVVIEYEGGAVFQQPSIQRVWPRGDRGRIGPTRTNQSSARIIGGHR